MAGAARTGHRKIQGREESGLAMPVTVDDVKRSHRKIQGREESGEGKRLRAPRVARGGRDYPSVQAVG